MWKHIGKNFAQIANYFAEWQLIPPSATCCHNFLKNQYVFPIHEFLFEKKLKSFLLPAHKAQMIRSSLNSVDLHFERCEHEKSMFHFHDKQRSKDVENSNFL